MAITSNTYTGNGTNKLFSITFPYLDTADVDVYLNGTLQTITTQYTFANATTVEFVTAPANGATILLDRSTDDTDLQATFFPGSAIKAADLNLDFDQVLYIAQETSNEATTATSTAASATTTANTALSQSAAAVSTANTASSNASAAVSTANTASTNASNAVTTANSAVSTANTATTTANSAVSTANTASSTASAAVSTANTASSNASAAVSTANTASSNATAAVSTANTASTTAGNAVTTANSAVTTANGAVTTANNAVTTANSAQTAANNAVVTSNLADTKANQAIAAVAASINYTLVANVAAIPASPANGTYIEVADSTGIESFTPLVGLPGGFIGDSGLTVRLVYQTSNTSWNWLTYFANNSETRYLKLAGGTLTGALAHPLGAAATPSITFTGDTNTGIYSPGADQVAISTGGSGRLFVDASGRILAGTASSSIGGSGSIVLQGSAGPGVVRAAFGGTSPGSTDILGAITFTDSSHTGAAYIYGSRDGGTWTSTTSQPSAITFGTTPNGSGTAFERLRITSAGLVGIGTSSPGSYSTYADDLVISNGFAGITLASATSGYGSIYFADGTAGTDVQRGAIQYSHADDYLRFSTAVNERMRIDSSGRVGIGTTSPSYLLDLAGAGVGVGATQSLLQLRSASDASGNSVEMLLTPLISGQTKTAIGAQRSGATSNAELYFSVAGSERARIDSSGRLGIGTSAPQDRLSVNASAANTFAANFFGPLANLNHVLVGLSDDATTKKAGIGFQRVDGFRRGSFFIFNNNDANASTSGGINDARLTVTSAGLVGIGTTSPAFKLDVQENTAQIVSRLLNTATSTSSIATQVIAGNNGSTIYQVDVDGLGTVFGGGARLGTYTNHPLGFATNNTERARIDSSGRLLVGTSSSPSLTDGQYSKLHVIGNSNSATGNGFINIGRGLAASGALAGGTGLGVLQFTDNAGAVHAAISGDTDATTGTNDYPGRLVFSTTADGAASPTERMRITSTGAQFSVIPGGSTIYPQFACRAWVNFDGTGTFSPNPSTSKIRASGNVSSITDNGTGNYTINFTTAMPDTNFAYTCSVGNGDHTSSSRTLSFISSTASSLRVLAETTSTGANTDEEQINVAIFR
jgi:hypothetical protein